MMSSWQGVTVFRNVVGKGLPQLYCSTPAAVMDALLMVDHREFRGLRAADLTEILLIDTSGVVR